jgi:hypothetical protein
MRSRSLLVSLILALPALASTLAQSLAPVATLLQPRMPLWPKATTVRDSFVARIHADGFHCPIPIPTNLVEDVPSFGQYDDKTNVIRTPDWILLNPQQRAFFFQLACPDARKPTSASSSNRALMADFHTRARPVLVEISLDVLTGGNGVAERTCHSASC